MDQVIHAARPAKANYTYSVTNGVVCVMDQGGGKSVTNDAEAVIADLGANGVDLNQPVIYRDTEGQWDELVVRNGRFSDFRFLRTRDQNTAIDRATLRAVAERSWHPDAAGVLDRIEHRGARARFEGDEFVMDGPTGRHALYRGASDIERMAAHWRTFCYMTDQHREPETHRAALELARAYLATFQTRESSYDRSIGQIGEYRLDYWEAAEAANIPQPFRTPVICLLVAGYADTHEWASAIIRDDHLSALQRAGSNEVKFHDAFQQLRADPVLDTALTGAIAEALTGTAKELPTKDAALGAIETAFYAQQQSSQQTAEQGHGR